MMKPPMPDNESQRVAALHRTGVLDGRSDPIFQHLTRIVQQVLGTRSANLTFIDSDRQWQKAGVGQDLNNLPRDFAFCAHTILRAEPLVITDATQDSRFAENPLVTGGPGLRSYIGMPIVTPEGFAIGAVCGFDTAPRPEPTEQQIAILKEVASTVIDIIEQKMAARATEIARMRLVDAVEALGEGFIMFDPEDRLVTINRKQRALFPDLADLFQPGTSLKTLAEAAFRRNVWQAEDIVNTSAEQRVRDFHDASVVTLRRTNTNRWIRTSQYRTHDGYAVGIYSDVTDIKESEAELVTKTALLQATIDAVSKGIGAFDAAGKLSACNRAFLSLLRVPDHLGRIGTPFAEFLAQDEGLAACVPIGRRGAIELDHIRLDGRIVSIRSTPVQNGGFVATVIDVTHERNNAEELTRRSHLYHRLGQIATDDALPVREALANVLGELCAYAGCAVGHASMHPPGGTPDDSDGIWHESGEVDSARFRTVTAEVCIQGQDMAAMAWDEGKPVWVNDLAGLDCRRARSALGSGLRSGFAFPIHVGRGDAGIIECYSTVPGVPEASHHEVIGYVAAQVGRIMERSQILRLKEEFVSTVSHELRTPLTSIRGSLGLMLGPLGSTLAPQVKGLVDIAHRNAERLIALVNDILDIDKVESGQMEFHLRPVELPSVLAEAIEANAAYAAERGVKLLMNPDMPALVALTDPQRLLQVLANLLSNAAKFSPSGEVVEITMLQREDQAEISVMDHGSGIPEDFKSRIFQKFAQADGSDSRNKNGTGLGLSIVKAIVERLGGTIGFDSRPGSTRFTFTLPLVSRESVEDLAGEVMTILGPETKSPYRARRI